MTDGRTSSSEGGRPDSNGPRRRRLRPRKFTIQSTFGKARRPRSRKNRPCDECRRRKTACVITTDPPCVSCKRKGIPCESTPVANLRASNQSLASQRARHERVQDQPQISSSPTGTNESRHVLASNTDHGASAGSAASPYDLIARIDQQLGIPQVPYYSDPALLVHQGLVLGQVPSVGDRDVGYTIDTSSVSPTPYTLEDIPGHCAYLMGPQCEQDGFLLDAFRYGIFGDQTGLTANIAQVHPGDASSAGQRPVHFLILRIGHLDHVNRERQQLSDNIEAKVWPYGENLVRLFFRHVHSVLPIMSKVRFLTRYHADKTSLPACLRGVIYALASVFWNHDITLKEKSMPFQQHELVEYAHQVLRKEIENPNLFVLQACLLLQHVTPPSIDTMEAPTTWTFAAQATACAQMIGLHLEPEQWNINITEKHLRRRLWWATFYADCWSSVCHGNPPHIASTSYNTSALAMEDMRCDEDVPDHLHGLVESPDTHFEVSTGARFLQMIDIACSLRRVLDCSYQVDAGARSMNATVQAQADLLAVASKLKEWTKLIPSCLNITQERRRNSETADYNCPLHLSFYATQVLLYRALMYPSTREAKFKPGSNLREWLPKALLAFEAFVEFLACLNRTSLAGFWGRHARSQFVLCGNFLVFLFLLASEHRDIERAYALLENFHQTMHALWDTDDEQLNTLIRAAKLRIDSFFSQAAEIMRRGASNGLQSS